MIHIFYKLIKIRIIYTVPHDERSRSQHATFSFGPDDGGRIEALRTKLGRRGHLLNRSEIVRLALIALAAQDASDVDSFVEQLKRLRPGRAPRSGKP
jgi:hypothetical protein